MDRRVRVPRCVVSRGHDASYDRGGYLDRRTLPHTRRDSTDLEAALVIAGVFLADRLAGTGILSWLHAYEEREVL